MTHKFTLTIKLANDLKDYENKDKKFSIRNHSYLYYIHFAKLNCLYDRLYDVAIIIFFFDYISNNFSFIAIITCWRTKLSMGFIWPSQKEILRISIKDVFITWKRINLVVPLNKEESKWNYFMVKVHQLYDTN